MDAPSRSTGDATGGLTVAVMNCNTSAATTEAIAAGARGVARAGTTILPLQPDWGPVEAEGYYDSYVTAAAVLDRLHRLEVPVDGLVMAGFGEHGREGARQLLDVPVVDITEAAAMHAMLLGHRYGVVTTTEFSIPQIEDSLLLAGLDRRCTGVAATDISTASLEDDDEATVAAFVAAGRGLLARGAEVLCLGCSGMTGIRHRVEAELGVPVVDGVASAVAIVEGLVAAGLRTSKVRAYSRPLPTARPGWPITR